VPLRSACQAAGWSFSSIQSRSLEKRDPSDIIGLSAVACAHLLNGRGRFSPAEEPNTRSRIGVKAVVASEYSPVPDMRHPAAIVNRENPCFEMAKVAEIGHDHVATLI
jgi:hypothetical protein